MWCAPTPHTVSYLPLTPFGPHSALLPLLRVTTTIHPSAPKVRDRAGNTRLTGWDVFHVSHSRRRPRVVSGGNQQPEGREPCQ